MKAIDVQKYPTGMSFKSSSTIPNDIHESLFRSWHIVNKVVEELEAGTPNKTILELIELMRTNPVDVDSGDVLSYINGNRTE